jgi:hypothetical protein
MPNMRKHFAPAMAVSVLLLLLIVFYFGAYYAAVEQIGWSGHGGHWGK